MVKDSLNDFMDVIDAILAKIEAQKTVEVEKIEKEAAAKLE